MPISNTIDTSDILSNYSNNIDNSISLQELNNVDNRQFIYHLRYAQGSVVSLRIAKVAKLQAEWKAAVREAHDTSSRSTRGMIRQSRALLQAMLYQIEMLSELGAEPTILVKLTDVHTEQKVMLDDIETVLPRGIASFFTTKGRSAAISARAQISEAHKQSVTASQALRRENALKKSLHIHQRRTVSREPESCSEVQRRNRS